MAKMTVAEAIDVFERDEIPHRFLETGYRREVISAVKMAGDVLAAEVRRLQGEHDADTAELRIVRESLTTAQREVERLTRERGAAIEAAWEPKEDIPNG